MTAITDLDATALSEALATGRLSSVEVMTAFLDRIEAANPTVNAIVSLRERDALIAEAAAADRSPRKGWLHGIPVAIKDLVETAGIRTTHGSPIFADNIPTADDVLAARIRAAGAILIGKTNASEFGLGSHSYNRVFGVTRNPYNPAKSAGGSSGGAGAALASRMVPVADGSDMMGSLRNPAAFNNVYGFRPTYGLVSADPVGELFLHQLSTDGPMARSVHDLARLLDTVAGPHPQVPHSLPRVAPFANRLDGSIAGKRIGWLGDWAGHYPVDPEILTLGRAAVGVFEELGCAVEEIVPDFDPTTLWSSWLTLRSFAVSSSLGVHYDNPAQRDLLKPEAIFETETGRARSADDIRRASLMRSQWYATLARLFERYDALVLPSAQVFPFDADMTWPKSVCGRSMSTYHQWMEIVVPVSLVGVPALGLPAGFGSSGLPAGIQLFGPKHADAAILQLGEAYHRATDWPGKRPPQLVPSREPSGL